MPRRTAIACTGIPTFTTRSATTGATIVSRFTGIAGTTVFASIVVMGAPSTATGTTTTGATSTGAFGFGAPVGARSKDSSVVGSRAWRR